ncbi:MAG: MFS transporter [Chloroflexi bacterium]|nr:MFS transporter [Chloroflexota bacterium]
MRSVRRIHYAWLILVMGTLAVFGALGLARFGYSVVLPAMQEGLGLNNTEAGALATANLLGYLALSAIGGALAAQFGPRTTISWGLVVCGVGMLLTATAQNAFTAALWRALTGVGSGAANVGVMGMISGWFGRRRRGLATGIGVSGSSIGLVFVGPLVPRILEIFPETGWRMTWLFFGGIALLLAVGSSLILRDRPSEMGLEPLGRGEDERSVPRQTNKGLEWGRVYCSWPVWQLGLIYVAFGASYIIYMTFFAKHLMIAGGYSREQAGSLFSVVGFASLFCGSVWGALSDRIGRRWALFGVYLIQALAYALFALWAVPMGFTLSAIFYGLTAWSIPAIMAAACGDLLGSELAPAALGFITLFFGIGQAAAPSVAGAMADATGSFTGALLLAMGLALLGALGSLTIRKAD